MTTGSMNLLRYKEINHRLLKDGDNWTEEWDYTLDIDASFENLREYVHLEIESIFLKHKAIELWRQGIALINYSRRHLHA